MAKTDERQVHQAIERQMQVICLVDDLMKHRTIQRNEELTQTIREIRLETLEANAAVCRAWLADEMAA